MFFCHYCHRQNMLMIHFEHWLIDSVHEVKVWLRQELLRMSTDTNECLLTYETLAMSNDKIFLRDPGGKAEEDK